MKTVGVDPYMDAAAASTFSFEESVMGIEFKLDNISAPRYQTLVNFVNTYRMIGAGLAYR